MTLSRCSGNLLHSGVAGGDIASKFDLAAGSRTVSQELLPWCEDFNFVEFSLKPLQLSTGSELGQPPPNTADQSRTQ
jgi:hypothetical protein